MALVNTDLVSNDLNFYALVSGPVPSPFRNRRGRRSLLDVLLRRRRDSGLPLDMVPLSVVDLGVLQQQSQHLASRVSRASRDGNLETHNGNYAIE